MPQGTPSSSSVSAIRGCSDLGGQSSHILGSGGGSRREEREQGNSVAMAMVEALAMAMVEVCSRDRKRGALSERQQKGQKH